MRTFYVRENNGEGKTYTESELINMLLKPAKKGDSISSVGQVIGLLNQRLKKLKIEKVLGIFVDQANQIIKISTIGTGIEEQCSVFPRDIARKALRLHATGFLMAHNHPTGSINPSEADRAITRTVKAALDTLDIRFLDHIIIGDGYYSFRENGLLA